MRAKPRVRRRSNREPAIVKDAETRSAAILDHAFTGLDQALGQLVRFTADRQTSEPFLPRHPSRARAVARALAAEARRAADAANRARRAAGALFRVELRSVASMRERASAARRFAVRDRWCAARIAEMRQGFQQAARGALHWNARFRSPSVLLFPKFPPLPPPSLTKVWEDLQFHSFEGVRVPIRKAKFELESLGVRLKFALVSFPHFPGWTPKSRLLVSSGEVAVNGVTLLALDSVGPEVGGNVLPKGSTTPAVNFNGYMKILDAANIPAGCRIDYRTVWYPRSSYLPPGGGGGWQDATPGGRPGQPRADLPASGPGYGVGAGKSAMADFPCQWFFPGTGVCAYVARDDLWRTWIVLICPAKTTVLGYWQWGFRFVLHQGANGVENVTTQPGNGPAGVPAPPNGWPAAPSSGPTTWVPAAAAPAQATADYQAAFP